MGRELTEKQGKILDFINEFIEKAGYPPSLRDICAKFRINGPKNARKHLEALEKKGFIRRFANASRAIEVLKRPASILREAANEVFSVPIAGSVKAGLPHEAIEDMVGTISLDASLFKCKGAFALKAQGESMINAGISDGDYLIVRPQKTALHNDIVVALIDKEATVKRFLLKGSRMILKPESPSMEPVEIKKGADLSIIGKVVYIIKDLER